MDREQLKRHILREKGKDSWRVFADRIDVNYQDLWQAAKSNKRPKAGVLEGLKIEAVVGITYRKVKK